MPAFLWTQKQDFGPRPRTGHALAFDSRRNQTVLFGGDSLNSRLFNDTWEWDGTFWTQLGDMGPAPRKEHAMAYDSQRGGTLLFGGASDTTKLGDTWRWDGEAWTQLSNNGPQARSGHGLVFNQARNTVVLFGGESATAGLLGDTWEFNGDEWTQLDESGPAARKLHSMTYDVGRQRLVMFGGLAAEGVLNDTWEWNGTSWIQTADFGPDHCLGAAMAFTNSRAALYGGISSNNINPGPVIYNKSWDWDGRHWTQRQDIGPGHRWGHAMCFDSRRSSLVLFGGTSIFPAAPEGVLGDTWEHRDTSTPITPPDPGTPPQQVSIVALQVSPEQVPADQVENVVVLAGVLLSESVGDPLTIPLFFLPQALANNLPLPEGVQPMPLPSIVVEANSNTGQVSLPPGSIRETAVIFAPQPNDPANVISVVLSIV
jgi:hypothetical protein